MQDILFYVKKYGKDVILFTLITILLAITIYNSFIKTENSKDDNSQKLVYTELEEKNDKNNDTEIVSNFFVDIKGAVKKPGVYEVSNNMIINDVIKLAGGFNSNAYQEGINLSKKIKDEMVIYVYTKAEIKKYQEENNISKIENEKCEVPDYSICECINDKQSVIEVGENGSQNKNDTLEKKININTATKDELMNLSGVGESKALAIIKYREDNGKFKSPEDIMNVSGIGEKAFEKIKDLITV